VTETEKRGPTDAGVAIGCMVVGDSLENEEPCRDTRVYGPLAASAGRMRAD
jgi:hypothetical protein